MFDHHHWKDDEWENWRYYPDCGCVMCLDYEDQMMDDLEDDFWYDTQYPDDPFDFDEGWDASWD